MCYMEEIFVWSGFPDLLSWHIPRICLLVLEAGIIGCIRKVKMGGKKSCDPLGNGVRKLRETSTGIFSAELRMRLGDLELEEQKGSIVSMLVSLNFIEFHHYGRLEEACLYKAV